MTLHTMIAAGMAVTTMAVSVITLGVYALDKRRARTGGWRIRERTLHLLELLGGWPGGFVARRWIRHKSQARRFRIVSGLIIALHLFLWLALGAWALQAS